MSTDYYTSLMSGWPSLYPYKYPFPSYGELLRAGKRKVRSACRSSGVSPARTNLFVCMAMIETQHLAYYERDLLKNANTDGSANVSIFNLNEDMVQRLGCKLSREQLNEESALPRIVHLMTFGIDVFGLAPFLNYVRGGYDAWKDGVSYGAAGYRQAVATAVKLMDEWPNLAADDLRIEMHVPHV
jgi:hypothetical protein